MRWVTKNSTQLLLLQPPPFEHLPIHTETTDTLMCSKQAATAFKLDHPQPSQRLGVLTAYSYSIYRDLIWTLHPFSFHTPSFSSLLVLSSNLTLTNDTTWGCFDQSGLTHRPMPAQPQTNFTNELQVSGWVPLQPENSLCCHGIHSPPFRFKNKWT